MDKMSLRIRGHNVWHCACECGSFMKNAFVHAGAPLCWVFFYFFVLFLFIFLSCLGRTQREPLSLNANSRWNSWPGFKENVSWEQGSQAAFKWLLRCFAAKLDKAALIFAAGFKSRCAPTVVLSAVWLRDGDGLGNVHHRRHHSSAFHHTLWPRAATKFKYAAGARKTENCF